MILLTGASGFVGGALATRLQGKKAYRAVLRSPCEAPFSAGSHQVFYGDLSAAQDWREAVHDVDCVVHCAARVHVMDDRASDPLTAYRRVNVEGTLRLARQAAAAGVRRLIFISSVKAIGESTRAGHPFSADQPPSPTDAYGLSKLEAERGLRDLASATGMEVVIIRPPLVYGPGVKANFRSLMKWLTRRVPLPFGAIDNRRSLVGIDNLVDLVVTCIDHAAAANQVFLVSDDDDLSTSELLLRLGEALGRPARLIPVPERWLRVAASMIGKPELAHRLLSSLQLDVTKTRERLGWKPVVTVDEGLRRTAAHWLASQRNDG